MGNSICPTPFFDLVFSSGSFGLRRTPPTQSLALLEGKPGTFHPALWRPPDTFSFSGIAPVAIELQEHLGGIESAHEALEGIRSTHDEFTDFFGDVFDQLQDFSLELYARHKCQELGTQQQIESDEFLTCYRDDFRRCLEQLQTMHADFQSDQEQSRQSWREIRSEFQQFINDRSELQEARNDFRRIATELSAMTVELQHERTDQHELYRGIEGQMAQLAALAAEMHAFQATVSRDGTDAQIAAILESTQRQQADWRQQRQTLEDELEAMRRRAVEQTDALNEQKRLTAQQQAELAGEVKRMRSLLETLSNQVRKEPASLANTKTPPIDSSVLGTVLAQFDVLQRDVAYRRAKRTDFGPSSPLSGT